MPKYNYKFNSPQYIEETILDSDTAETIGTIRIKPTNILWKPKNQQSFYS